MIEQFVDSFKNSARFVIESMAMTNVDYGPVEIVPAGEYIFSGATGLIGYSSGESVRGVLIISFNPECIIGIAGSMLGEVYEELNQGVMDSVGELTNIIMGQAKRELSEKGFSFDMATPLMFKGDSVSVSPVSGGERARVNATTSYGPFLIEW
jgi:chemotaxis protein CheX